MGLDMYLTGHKFLWQNWNNPAADRKENGLRIKSIDLELGYWRKHPDLHGFIVQAFAEGKDECQDIVLDASAIQCVISAIKEKRLPHTTGFFFGKSDDNEDRRNEDIAIFERALAWLAEDTAEGPRLGIEKPIGGAIVMAEVIVPKTMPKESRAVIYRASW